METSPLGQALSNVECGPVLFFRTRAPIEPVSFVHRICSDALESANTQKHRWVRRLTPMSRMGKATEKGLETVSKAVLGPAFHDEGSSPKKVSNPVFAFIRHPSLSKSAHIRCAEPGLQGPCRLPVAETMCGVYSMPALEMGV